MCRRRAALFINSSAAAARPIAGTDFFLEQGRIDLAEAASVTDAEGILRIFCLGRGARLQADAER